MFFATAELILWTLNMEDWKIEKVCIAMYIGHFKLYIFYGSVICATKLTWTTLEYRLDT